jgi:hypothetical protein
MHNRVQWDTMANMPALLKNLCGLFLAAAMGCTPANEPEGADSGAPGTTPDAGSEAPVFCGDDPEVALFGEMVSTSGATGSPLLIAAPHGTFDHRTFEMVEEIAAAMQAHRVLARGFRSDDHFIHVNRPTEGSEETVTERARQVYNEFSQCVGLHAHDVYVELHGNSRAETAFEIQVATVGVDAALANLAKETFLQAREGVLWDYTLHMEPVDTLYWRASKNKELGMLSQCQQKVCLHFEFPRALREDGVRPEVNAAIVAVLQRVIP